MGKESFCGIYHEKRYPLASNSPMDRLEGAIIDNIFQAFGPNIKIFYQRKPSRNNPQTDTERAFRNFLMDKLGTKIKIRREPIEFVNVANVDGELVVKTTVPDWGLRLNGGGERILETTSSSERKHGKAKKAKLNSIVKQGFSNKVDYIRVLNMDEKTKPKKQRKNNTRVIEFRILDSNGKTILVKANLPINKATSRLRIMPLGKDSQVRVTLLCREHIEKIEAKHGVKIIYEANRELATVG